LHIEVTRGRLATSIKSVVAGFGSLFAENDASGTGMLKHFTGPNRHSVGPR
jgi:hypothetical protein